MRGQEPSAGRFFLDLIFLAMVIPVTAWVINYVISGIGPYNFTVIEILDYFFYRVDVFFLQIQGLINLFWIFSIILCIILFYEASKI